MLHSQATTVPNKLTAESSGEDNQRTKNDRKNAGAKQDTTSCNTDDRVHKMRAALSAQYSHSQIHMEPSGNTLTCLPTGLQTWCNDSLGLNPGTGLVCRKRIFNQAILAGNKKPMPHTGRQSNHQQADFFLGIVRQYGTRKSHNVVQSKQTDDEAPALEQKERCR